MAARKQEKEMAKGKLRELEVEKYLAECVQIFPEALNEEFVRMPADFAYWNERYADALRTHLLAKLMYDRTESSVRIECREKLLEQNAKVTESMVEAAVAQHPEFNEAREAVIASEIEKVRLGGVLDAIRTKRDMLISLGAHARIEMMNDPVVRERMAGAKMVGGGGG